MSDKVAAIVITFNRLGFLKEIIEALKNQTHKLDEIFVINNSSSDGTGEWLASQSGITVITQANLGSSGGQYTGFKAAFDAGYDWVWTMDDDVVPEPDCLEVLINHEDKSLIRTPLRILPDGKPFFNDAIDYNLTNPFRSIWNEIYTEKDLKSDITPAIGITFEGPLIHRCIIEKAGFPEKDFFIYGDDTEYFIRAWKSGAKIAVFKNARLNRKLMPGNPEAGFTWKHYYMVRNIIAIDVLQGSLPVRIIRPFGYLFRWFARCHTFGDFLTVLKGFSAGYFYKSNR